MRLLEMHQQTKTRKGGEKKMITEQEAVERITNITKYNRHVLDCGPATVLINAPRALMQLQAISKLDVFYLVIGKKRPRFKCDDRTKIAA